MVTFPNFFSFRRLRNFKSVMFRLDTQSQLISNYRYFERNQRISLFSLMQTETTHNLLLLPFEFLIYVLIMTVVSHYLNII